MPNIPITALPAASEVGDGDLLPVVRAADTTNYKATLAEVHHGMGPAITLQSDIVDVTGSRALATTYQASPLDGASATLVTVILTQTAAGTGDSSFLCDPATDPPTTVQARASVTAAGMRLTLQVLVPALSYYRVTASNMTIVSWTENTFSLGAATPTADPTFAHGFPLDELVPPIVDSVTGAAATITGADYLLGVAGVHGSTALEFTSGGNTYVEAPTALPPVSGLNRSFSWLLWAKRTANLIANEFPICMDQRLAGGAAGNGLLLLIDDDSSYRPFIDIGTGTLFANVGTAMTLNVWRHLAVTYDGEFLRLYVDGVVQTVVLSNGVLMDNVLALPLRLGRSNRAGALTGTSHCALDDVRVYNKPLNVAEIQAVMNDPDYVITGLWRL